jgi:large subunit ribosomal protein L9
VNVILLERIVNLGDLGDEVVVKSGFARNFLIPKGKAVRASKDNRAVFEARRAELERVAQERMGEAQGRAAKLQGITVTISAKAGDEGKLYGSVGTHDISEALAAQGAEVAKSEIRMPAGVIRVVGEYDIDVHLHTDVNVTIKVVVVPE